jgi:hypothetical protein
VRGSHAPGLFLAPSELIHHHQQSKLVSYISHHFVW